MLLYLDHDGSFKRIEMGDKIGIPIFRRAAILGWFLDIRTDGRKIPFHQGFKLHILQEIPDNVKYWSGNSIFNFRFKVDRFSAVPVIDGDIDLIGDFRRQGSIGAAVLHRRIKKLRSIFRTRDAGRQQLDLTVEPHIDDFSVRRI